MSRKSVLVSVAVAGLVLAAFLAVHRALDRTPRRDRAPAGGGPPDAAAADPKSTHPATDGGAAGDSTSPDPGARAGDGSGSSDARLPPTSIEGRIADAEGPVPGALVWALDATAWSDLLARVPRGFFGAPREALRRFREAHARFLERTPRIETDPEGRYAFRGLGKGEYRVLVSEERHLPHGDSWAFWDGKTPVRCDVLLAAAQAIRGRVLDRARKPVAGALVRVEPHGTRRVRGLAKLVQGFLDADDIGLLFRRGEARSLDDGSFAIGSLPPGLHDLEARCDGYGTGRLRGVAPEKGEVVIALRAAPYFTGRALDADGKPVSGAEVTVDEPEKEIDAPNPLVLAMVDFDLYGDFRRAGSTGDDGRFRIAAPTPGSFELRVRAPGLPAASRRVAVEREDVDVGDVVLARPLEITGTVVGPDGAPVEGARVWIPEDREDWGALRPGDREPAVAEASSDARGAFVLGGLAAGRYQVRAAADGVGETTAVAPGGREGIVLQLPDLVRVSGRAVDAEDGTPVEGAMVRVGPRRPVEARTGPDGSFATLVSRPEGEKAELDIVAEHPGYRPTGARLPLGGEDPIELRLVRAAGISGRVVDAAGGPVSGAKVRIDVPGIPSALLALEPRYLGSSDVTDEDGAFFLRTPSRVAGSSIELAAGHPVAGRARIAVPRPLDGASPWPEVTLVVKPPTAIEGRVTDSAGAPVVGAEVRAIPAADLPPELRVLMAFVPVTPGRSAYAGADGSYRVSGLEAGRYRIEACAIGYARRTAGPVEVGNEPFRLDLGLDAGGTIEGMVVGLSGEPFPGAEVVAFVEGGDAAVAPDGEEEPREPGSLERRYEDAGAPGVSGARTDADGTYRLTLLPEGALRVVARARGHAPAAVGPIEAGEDPADLTLVPYSRIDGRVLLPEGTAYPGAFLLALDGADGRPGEVRYARDPEGRFAIEEVLPGEYVLRVTPREHLPPRSRRVHLEPGAVETVDLVLSADGAIEGTVRSSADGTPVPGVHALALRVHDPGGGRVDPDFESAAAESDASGHYRIQGLADGSYRLVYLHPLFRTPGSHRPDPVAVSSEAPVAVDAVLEPAGRVGGKILGLPGGLSDNEAWWAAGIAEAAADDASAGGGGEPFRAIAQIEPDGTFGLDSLPPGVWKVALFRGRREGGALSKEPFRTLGTVEVRAGEATVLDADLR